MRSHLAYFGIEAVSGHVYEELMYSRRKTIVEEAHIVSFS